MSFRSFLTELLNPSLKAKTDDLVPAIRPENGKPIIGRRGQTHIELIMSSGHGMTHPEPERGFYNIKTKRYYSRDEIDKILGVDWLDSTDLMTPFQYARWKVNQELHERIQAEMGIVKNPSTDLLKALINKDEYQTLRYIAYQGNVWVLGATFTMHGDMAGELGLRDVWERCERKGPKVSMYTGFIHEDEYDAIMSSPGIGWKKLLAWIENRHKTYGGYGGVKYINDRG